VQVRECATEPNVLRSWQSPRHLFGSHTRYSFRLMRQMARIRVIATRPPVVTPAASVSVTHRRAATGNRCPRPCRLTSL
jgi:hypothetical protein